VTGPSLIGFDTETNLIGVGAIIPRLVCATFDHAPWGQVSPTEAVTDTWAAWCIPNSDPQLVTELDRMFSDVQSRSARLIIQEAAFDLTVLLRYATEVQAGSQVGNRSEAECLYGRIWDVLDQGMDDELAGGAPTVHDTIIREKLYNLSTFGAIDQYRGRDLRYSLADLVGIHFSHDIKGSKVSLGADGRILDHAGVDITGTAKAGAAWRLRYKELDGIPLERWPHEAIQYAIDDATWARKVFVSQEQARMPRYYGSMNSESLQVASATALRLMGAIGFPVDQQQVERVKGRIAEVTAKVDLSLKFNGVVRADDTVCKKVIQDRVLSAWAIKGEYPQMTVGSDKNPPQICTADEVLDILAGVDPVIDMYRERQGLAKIATAFIPSLAGGHIWSDYDVLKETGRVSSRGGDGGRGRAPLYPSMNIQQIPKSHGVRECFLPPTSDPILPLEPSQAPPGWVLMSCDYNSMELCSVAQVTYTLLGFSVHREKINLGYDLHSFLGSAIAMRTDPALVSHTTVHEDAYKEFQAKRKRKVADPKEGEPEDITAAREAKKVAGLYRNFAKPTGLGYPGGLGPETMRTMAKAVYSLDISSEQSKVFRDLWHTTYPEMRQFFNWVNKQSDANDPAAYVYETSGFNRFRAGATYCATANGKAMQSLGADGAKRAAFYAAKAALGGVGKESPYWLLKGCLPAAFIHDEILLSSPDDDLLTERALLVSQLMVEAMQISMPDVIITVEPALMRRWTKKAEPEWTREPGRGARVEAAICRAYGGQPPQAWIDELFRLLGPSYDPERRLIPYDDVHALDVLK